MSLDDPQGLGAVDRSGMLGIMGKTPTRLVPPPDASSTCPEDFKRPSNIVFGGVGGSGIGGDVLCDYCRETSRVPVSVCRSLKLPAFVGKDCLFVAISYSGETTETLTLFEQAHERMAQLAVVCSGGRLFARAKALGVPYLKIQPGMLPRVALPELLAATIFLMGRARVIENPNALLSGAAKSVASLIVEVEPTVPTQKNAAKRAAQSLPGKLPILIGSEENISVLRRFKNELNENSKVPAFYYTFPEGYHDDVEGLKTLSGLAKVQPIILESAGETAGQRKAREKLTSLLADLGFLAPVRFSGMSEERLGWLLTAITFGDYVSAYLAALRNVDPAELTLIPSFRDAMRTA